jgi:hypothetical protein
MFSDDLEAEPTGKKLIVLGSGQSGIVLRISKKGLEFNGYYAGLREAVKHANLREYVFITWDELEKLRKSMYKRKKKKKTRGPDKTEEAAGDYLETLPVVTMNGKKYYLDEPNKQIRPLDNPQAVYNFRGLATKKPN